MSILNFEGKMFNSPNKLKYNLKKNKTLEINEKSNIPILKNKTLETNEKSNIPILKIKNKILEIKTIRQYSR